MKKIFIILFLLLSFSCFNQTIIDYSKYMNVNELMLTSVSFSNKKYYYSYIEQSYIEEIQSKLCFFIIPQEKDDYVSEKIELIKCSTNVNHYGKYRCALLDALKNDSSIMKTKLAIYGFLISKENIYDEPFIENVEGGAYSNYYVKENSKVKVFKYNNNGQWYFIEEILNPKGDNARIIGSKYIELLLEKKVMGGIQ